MTNVRVATVEADIAALKRAAERAGTALACLFSCSDEYEADLIRERRAAGAYRNVATQHRRHWRWIASVVFTGVLVFAFLML
jgi:hypothetical protein